MLLISPGISERGPDTPRKSTKVAPYPLHRQPCSVSLSILSHNSACVHRVASTRTGAKKIWQAMMEKQLPRQRLSWIIMKNSPNPAKQMHKCLLKITVESRQKQNVKTSLGSTTLGEEQKWCHWVWQVQGQCRWEDIWESWQTSRDVLKHVKIATQMQLTKSIQKYSKRKSSLDLCAAFFLPRLSDRKSHSLG